MNIRDQIASARALADAATKGPLLFRGKDSTVRQPGPPPYEYGSLVIARFTENDDACAEVSEADLDLWLAASTLVPQLATLLERACELLEAYGKECPCRGDPACDVCPQSRAFLAGEVKP
jgi:hypothetical protein